MYRFCACVFVLPALLLCNTAAAQDKLTYGDIAGRLYDLERLAEPPIEGERGGAWTSADRRGRYDAATGKYVNWGANGDGGGFMRREGDSFVAAEIDGPGVLWRFWSAMPGAGHVRIFIDGNAKPAIDKPFGEYFAEFEKTYPHLALTLSRGRNRFIPIPFQKSCKVLLGPKWGKYFHITYSKFPQSTKVESFAGFNDEIHASLKKANAVWGARGQNPHKPGEGAKVVRQKMTLAAGENSELKINGAKAIRAIKIRPALPQDVTAQEDALREMTLAIKWDGEPTPSVWAPLGDFFATSPGVNLYKALPMGMTKDGFYCYWYMPFEKGAVIELTNDGKEPRQLEIEVETAPLAKPAGELLRFHVCDDVPFRKSFEGVIEKYGPNYNRQGKPCLFDTVVYWYAMPGSKSPYKQVPLAERVHPRPTPKPKN